MPHRLIIVTLSDNLLEIHFSLASEWEEGNYDQINRDTMIALRTLLTYIGYEEGNDANRMLKDQKYFVLTNNPDWVRGILIRGRSNVITILALLFNSTQLFSFRPLHTDTVDKERHWIQFKLLQLIALRISDKDLSETKLKNAIALAKPHYDAAFTWLNDVPLVQQLLNNTVLIDSDNILKHRFFQTISLILDDYIAHNSTPQTQHRLFALPLKRIPEAGPYHAVLDKFMPLIPNCYLSRKSKGHNYRGSNQFFIIIDPDKIRQPRPQSVQLTAPTDMSTLIAKVQ